MSGIERTKKKKIEQTKKNGYKTASLKTPQTILQAQLEKPVVLNIQNSVRTLRKPLRSNDKSLLPKDPLRTLPLRPLIGRKNPSFVFENLPVTSHPICKERHRCA